MKVIVKKENKNNVKIINNIILSFILINKRKQIKIYD
jgi:hypothetical protein